MTCASSAGRTHSNCCCLITLQLQPNEGHACKMMIAGCWKCSRLRLSHEVPGERQQPRGQQVMNKRCEAGRAGTTAKGGARQHQLVHQACRQPLKCTVRQQASSEQLLHSAWLGQPVISSMLCRGPCKVCEHCCTYLNDISREQQLAGCVYCCLKCRNFPAAMDSGSNTYGCTAHQ